MIDPKISFDELIERRGTGAIKTDSLLEIFGRDDLIPLWIADMDFLTPPCVVEAIQNRCTHSVLGYTKPTPSYYDAIINWLQRRHQWRVTKEDIGFVSGIVPGLAFCIKAFSCLGDKILIQPPVYPPFHHLPINNERILLSNPLSIEGGEFKIDFEDFEQKLKGTRLFILCNPHNPGGRVWAREELQQIAKLCHQYGVLVISDEIHADLVLEGHKHIPFASVSDEAKFNSVTLMAPSKTFNMAGLSSSYHIIFNKSLKKKLDRYLQGSELANGHTFAFCAAEAAYNYGEEWLQEAISYIKGNIAYVHDYLHHHMPNIKAMEPQASFLLWLDCTELNMTQEELVSFFVNKARLALNNGEQFGKEGVGFMRLNVGCPRALLEKAMEQLYLAYKIQFITTK